VVVPVSGSVDLLDEQPHTIVIVRVAANADQKRFLIPLSIKAASVEESIARRHAISRAHMQAIFHELRLVIRAVVRLRVSAK
jgi:hypothetical protein